MSGRKKRLVVGSAVVLAAAALTLALTLTLCPHRHTHIRLREATCTTAGERATVCDRCEKVLDAEPLAALGHLYGEWALATAPTIAAEGAQERVCARDPAHTERRTLPRLDDAGYTRTVLREPTCRTAGEAEYVSTEYGVYRAAIPKLAHKLADGTCTDCGERVYSAGITYTLSDDRSYYIVSDGEYRVRDTELIIPDRHEEIPVKAIAAEGFAERTWLKSVVIPAGIERIGDGAFSGAGIETVYYHARNCADFNARNWVFYPGDAAPALRLIVGKEVERLPARMFYPLATDPFRLPDLREVTFAADGALTEIGAYAFYRAAGLAQISLPEGLVEIGEQAFYGAGLTRAILPDSLADVRAGAFGTCVSLADVTFGAGLKTIGDDAFNYCTALRRVDLRATELAAIGKDAFKNCASLTAAALGASCTKIGAEAFAHCGSLAELELGAALTTIGAGAFRGCSSLAELTLPAGLLTLGDNAFADCARLERLYFCAVRCADLASGNGVFAGCGAAGAGLTVTIGPEVRRIPARLFYATSELARAPRILSVTVLARDLESVGAYAFFGAAPMRVDLSRGPADWTDVLVEAGNESILSGANA